MDPLYATRIDTPEGAKTLSVYCCDLRAYDEPLDVMTISAFYHSYAPVPHTLLHALAEEGIDVYALAQHPQVDLRDLCNIWLSDEVEDARLPIARIGCIEMSPYRLDRSGWESREKAIISSIQSYFRLLDIASRSGVRIETLGLPILGGGEQHVSLDLVAIPILNECLSYLRDNPHIRSISVITRSQPQAYQFARAIEGSYALTRQTRRPNVATAVSDSSPYAFISYSSHDKNVADNLCARLEASGVRVWYAPRDVGTIDYATSIVDAIARCSHFVVILSASSMASEHVLNEVDLAFQELGRGLRFCPLKIDEESMGPAFRYYLSRQNWMDAHLPPLERRLDEFVAQLLEGRQG